MSSFNYDIYSKNNGLLVHLVNPQTNLIEISLGRDDDDEIKTIMGLAGTDTNSLTAVGYKKLCNTTDLYKALQKAGN